MNEKKKTQIIRTAAGIMAALRGKNPGLQMIPIVVRHRITNAGILARGE